MQGSQDEHQPRRKKLGLIINPIAGLGGRVGLKGSDEIEIQRRARALGAIPQAGERTAQALLAMRAAADHILHKVDVICAPGEMGAQIAIQCGFQPRVVGQITPGETSAEDTMRIAVLLQSLEVDLILFAGGDGTARDLCKVLSPAQVVLGIPAGVKIHSAVYANTPSEAGRLAADFLNGRAIRLREAEVVDLDEMAYRQGVVATRLYGLLTVPYQRALLQNQKTPTPASEAARQEAIAAQVIEMMKPGWIYILGPGTTTRAICARLNLPKTLVGVDVISTDGVVALDVNEAQLLEFIAKKPAQVIVTPVGGQGFLLGRGNQPLSPVVLRTVGKENLLVISLVEKLNALRGQPLRVDTGDAETDRWLSGYYQVITGYGERVVYRVSA